MDWRESLLERFGPGVLAGIALGDWLRLLRERRFAIAPSCLPRALAITFQSTLNSVFRRLEERRYGREIGEVAVQPPLFILGHWRSGTTHLHNLLAVDERFAFLNNYQTFYPHTFLSTENRSARWIELLMPRRRPMDNIEWDMASPQEDEFALCVLTRLSPCMGWVFPRLRERYDRYLTFRDVGDGEIEAWRQAFQLLLKKATFKLRRPLLLKSPPHTARIRLLLELFPGARFVHIHRDPFTVFQSSRRMFEIISRWHRLERPLLDDLDDWILRQYHVLYEAYFEQRGSIPAGRLHEVRYESLEKDPGGEIRRLYEALGLPDFAAVEPALRGYTASLAGYRKNSFPELPADLRARVAREWSRSFAEWGYPT